ncbi:MAG: putative DNA-binding protein [Clostridia bacterium]|nr:putative DNA-binding protein [Clostridia bacterium]
MERKVEISILLDIYSSLLTKKQFEFLDDYYNKDLSLSEIAENENITRQAVRDNLKKGECKLFEYEEKLGIMKKTIMQEEKISVILSEITKITDKMEDREIANVLEDVKNKLNCLV